MKLLVLPGDGIGPEITEATLAVLGAADKRFKLGLSYERMDMGLVSLKSQGTTLPEGILACARSRRRDPRSDLAPRLSAMDLVIMRECTEGFYPDRNMFQGNGEFMPVPGVALSVRKITETRTPRPRRKARHPCFRQRGRRSAVSVVALFQHWRS